MNKSITPREAWLIACRLDPSLSKQIEDVPNDPDRLKEALIVLAKKVEDLEHHWS